MKTDLPASRQRAGQRLLSTVIVVTLGLVLTIAVHSLIGLDTLLVRSSVLAYSHLIGSYRRYMVFLTIFIVLLRASCQLGSRQLALFRVATTFAGFLLTLLVAYTLRSRERRLEPAAQTALL